MIGSLSLTRFNRLASLAILPMMTLAIVVFSRFAEGPDSSADPPSEGVLVVANLRTESLNFLDLKTGRTSELALPGPPHEMLSLEGRIYVTLGRGNALVEIEPAAPAILRVVPIEGEPHGLAPWGSNLVVTLDKANEVLVLDRTSLTEVRRYPTGQTPHAVAVSEEAILVTDSRDNTLRQIEPGHATVATGIQPEGIAIAGGYAATADAVGGTLTIARSSDLSGVRRIVIGEGPVRVVAFVGTEVLVSLQGKGQVAVIDVAKAKVRHRINTAARPDGLCVSPEAGYFAAASNADGIVDAFARKDWKRAARYTFQAGLGACLWLPPR